MPAEKQLLTDKQLQRYADVMIWGLTTAREKKLKKNDIILLRYEKAAVKLAEIIFKKLLEMGLNPIQRMTATSAMERDFYVESNNSQLVFRPPGEDTLFENIHGSIYLLAPESITHLADIDPKRIGKATLARKYIRDILDEREASGDFGWTLCVYPTDELASHAQLSTEDYSKQIIKACFLNRTDPVAQWEDILAQATEIKKWLNSLKTKSLHIESANMDLTITPGEQRRWIGISGHNIPSFELFLSPDWRGTSGVYFANQPSFRSGNYVSNVRIEFTKGNVTDVKADDGEEFTKKIFAIDKGASRVGEFSLTDKRFSKINAFMANTLFDENYGGKQGNCHIALGSSYADTFSGNLKDLDPAMKRELGFNDSALHWDLVNTEKKRVKAKLANGESITIYENGQFV